MSISLRAFIYKIQFFTLLASAAILSFQYELFMIDRQVALPLALTVFSISQISVMVTNLTIRRFSDKVRDPNRILQVALTLRTVTMLAIFFTQHPFVFIGLFLLYQVAAAANIVFESMSAQWAFSKNIGFSSLRIYGSLGFAIAGFMVTFIYGFTGSLNAILLFLFALNLINAIFAFTTPVVIDKSKADEEANGSISRQFRLLIFLGAFTVALSNAFGVILNNHYRYAFGLSVGDAIQFVSIAVLLGSFVSEIVGFKTVDPLVNKFSAKNIVFTGILLSLARWSLSFFSPNAFIFTLTYLFHGFTFAYIYLGILAFGKARYGNAATNKVVMDFIIFSNITTLALVQLTNLILAFTTTGNVLLMLVGVNLLTALSYYFSSSKTSKDDTTPDSPESLPKTQP